MKRTFATFAFILICILSVTPVFSQEAKSGAGQVPQTGNGILKQMHTRYFKGPCKAYTFSQRNTHYRNDSIVRHSEWHEAVEFPDKFKIIFGDTADGNAVVFKNDSAYNYKRGKLMHSRPDSNMILLLIGGMYYRPFTDVVARVEHAKYNLKVMSEQKWQNRDVYVIGAKGNDLAVNQLWIEKSSLRVVRIIENLNKDNRMDMTFETHEPMCKGYVETKVTFRRNGNLEQVEEYYNIKQTNGFKE